jgi:hypothetical protein
VGPDGNQTQLEYEGWPIASSIESRSPTADYRVLMPSDQPQPLPVVLPVPESSAMLLPSTYF